MIDNSFRKLLPKYTGSLISFYKWMRLTPNHISVISLLISCIAAFFITKDSYIIAICLWWLGRILDGTDGIYARATQQESLFGAFLDIICDMASYSIMILAFSYAFPEYFLAWQIILFLYILCITGALSLGSLQEKRKSPSNDNRGLRLAAGLAEGGETGIAYTVFLLLPQFIHISIWIWVSILVATVIARIVLAFQELSE